MSAEAYLQDVRNSFFYVGDLDYEGIIIFEAFAKNFTQSAIMPFIPAYTAMLALSRQLDLPFARAGQNKKHSGHFMSFFEADCVAAMETILQSGRYIPQEILTPAEWCS